MKLGVAIALVLVGTAMACAGAIWGLLPRQSDLPRWGAAASVFDLLSGSGRGRGWFLLPAAISTALLFSTLVHVLEGVRRSRHPWLGAAITGVGFALVATAVTGFLLGIELAVVLDGNPPLDVRTRLMLPFIAGLMAVPVVVLVMPVPVVVTGAAYGLLVARCLPRVADSARPDAHQ